MSKTIFEFNYNKLVMELINYEFNNLTTLLILPLIQLYLSNQQYIFSLTIYILIIDIYFHHLSLSATWLISLLVAIVSEKLFQVL